MAQQIAAVLMRLPLEECPHLNADIQENYYDEWRGEDYIVTVYHCLDCDEMFQRGRQSRRPRNVY